VEALLRGYASAGTQLDYAYPEDGPGGGMFAAMAAVERASQVQTELPYAMFQPALIRKIVWAEREGYDAVVLRNAFDPAVEQARLAVRIPLVGACRATLHVAATLADRIGVTIPFDGYLSWTRRLIRSYGMEPFVMDVRSLSLPGIHGLDLTTRRAEIFERAREVMRGLLQDGAECIVPLGAAVVPSTVAAEDLERDLGAPVLNTNAIAIRFAEMCVALGITHSRGTYPSVELGYEAYSAPAWAGRTYL
jgi:Asp/Glu/hydantoin racemase